MRMLVLAVLVVVVFPARPCVAQMVAQKDTAYTTVYYGVLMPAAREYLESRWSEAPDQLERGYCVGAISYSVQWAYDKRGRTLGKEVLARVWSIYEADTLKGATPSSIADLGCVDGKPTVHTHPPTTCEDDEDATTCVFGGSSAFQCQPSRTDFMTLVRDKHRFSVIQCDKRAFRFYWPSEYRADVALTP